MFDQSLGPADRQILRAILAAQERTLTDIQELIKMTDALQTAVADLQATDATLVTAVNAFIANAVGTLQQQLAAAQAALAAVQAQQNLVQFAIFLHVIQQPGVLHLQRGRWHGPAQEIEVFHLVKV